MTGICQFGLAHVDTPKGDLDASSGALSGPGTTVIAGNDVYHCGTTEQYPAATDSSGNVLENYAHEYRECSNKGLCDRSSGTCQCFDGYEGTACQRASCPSGTGGVCSGHGTCHTIKELAALDNDNIYDLWDQHSTMGCLCDGGWTGADCSEKICKSGVDPLYFDEVSTQRYSNWTYELYAATSGVTLYGNYSIIFTDSKNKEWSTIPISWNATCAEVTDALEGIPNKVIPSDSVKCYKSDIPNGGRGGDGYGRGSTDAYNGETNYYVYAHYIIAFSKNPGYLKQIKLNKYLDGTRPTLYTSETTSTLGWHIYPNGFHGEDVDMVNDYCSGVTVTLGYVSTANTHYLSGLDVSETKLLKKCLGDADGDSSDNVEVYNWDYGTSYNPHLIKLVEATQYLTNGLVDVDLSDCNEECQQDLMLKMYPSNQLCTKSAGNSAKFGSDAFGVGLCSNLNPAGFYAALYFDDIHYPSNPFRLYTRAAQDYTTAGVVSSAQVSTTQFFVFTTQGYLNLVNPYSVAFTRTSNWNSASEIAAAAYSNVLHLSNTTTGKNHFPGYAGNIDCETNSIGENGARDCLNKGDYIMLFASGGTGDSDANALAANPAYPNIYTVEKIFRNSKTNKYPLPINANSEKIRNQIHLNFGVNAEYQWQGGNTTAADTTAWVYKFHPSTANADGGYRYVGQCSNRGICNTDTGLCECFHGYTNDNCDTINALAQ